VLILSRKQNETIIVGSGEKQIEVVVLRIDGGKVRLGIKAAADVRIMREEINGHDHA
jgi:carbon storage regulator